MKKLTIPFFCILLAMGAFSQPSFVAKVDSLKMQLGDQQKLTLTYITPDGNSPAFKIENLDTTTFFEIVSQTPWLRSQEAALTKLEKKIVFSIFDEGRFEIPSVSAIAGEDSLFTFPIPIEVTGIEPDTTGLLPIKGIVKEKNNWTDYLSYIIGASLLLIGFLIYRYIQKQKNKKQEEVFIPVPIIKLPHEIALEKLGKLKESKMWETGEIKEYHSQLTYIIREYLENRFKIPALESTSHEIIRDLKSHITDKDSLQTVHDILNIADWVKFAKGIPEESANAMALDKAIELILTTREEKNPITSSNTIMQ